MTATVRPDPISDEQLALRLSAALFALAAWPLLLVDVPPFQDLPNHLATVTVLLHPSRYPEFVFNGFLKTNGALFAWLYFVGRAVGLPLASRLFTALVLAVGALVLPRFVLEMTGSRGRMKSAMLFAWPFVHNWFVSMGMLDFALGVPLSLFALMLLERQRKEWSWARAAAIAGVAVLTWYAHVFALLVVHLLVGIHVLVQAFARRGKGWRERLSEVRLLVPLLPGTALALASLYGHLTEPGGAMQGYVKLSMQLPPWELLYNAWSEWQWGFTSLSITSLVATLGLAFFGWKNRRECPPFFGGCAFLAMGLAYLFVPYIATNWFHVNSRFIPYLWVAALLRVPEHLDRRAVRALVASAALYSLGMGIDYVRLDRDRAEFTAGMDAVPEGSHLLPLIFRRKLTSENTRSLLHAWGFYVMQKQTDAPLLFAHSRSFPVMYREPPPPRFNHIVLETFAPDMTSPDWMCGTLRRGGIVEDCGALYRQVWSDFWKEAVPRYDHVLLWDATPEAKANVPAAYRVSFEKGRLTVLERAP